jgi:hypothetical protein
MSAYSFVILHVEELLGIPRPKNCIVDEFVRSNLKQHFNM